LHEGMGATYVREVKRRDIFLSTVLTIALLVGLISIHLLFLSIIVSLAGLIFLNYVKNRIGGVVGDVLGASEQIAETVILFYFVFISTHSLGSSWLIF
jgi:adenosylcobinamide-GDP ribazoletransferase